MPHPDEGLLHAWLDGELDAAESARIEALVASDPAWAAAAAEARGLIAASSRIVRALDHVPAGVIPRSTSSVLRRAPRWWMARVAALLLVAAGTSVVWRTSQPSLVMEPAVPGVVPAGAAAVVSAPPPKEANAPTKVPTQAPKVTAPSVDRPVVPPKVVAKATDRPAPSPVVITAVPEVALKRSSGSSVAVRTEAVTTVPAVPAAPASAAVAEATERKEKVAAQKDAMNVDRLAGARAAVAPRAAAGLVAPAACFVIRVPAQLAGRTVKHPADSLSRAIWASVGVNADSLVVRDDALRRSARDTVTTVAVRAPCPR